MLEDCSASIKAWAAARSSGVGSGSKSREFVIIELGFGFGWERTWEGVEEWSCSSHCEEDGSIEVISALVYRDVVTIL